MGFDDWRTRVREGNEFDDRVQGSWKATERTDPRNRVTVEAPVTKPSGRRGRIDVRVEIGWADATIVTGEVAVVENKDTRWDGLSDERIQARVDRHARQIWQYIEAHLGKVVAPGVIVRKDPRDPAAPDAEEREARAASIERDDKRKRLTTVWARYTRIRPGEELRVAKGIVVMKLPRSKARADALRAERAARGVTLVWDKELERDVYPGITLRKRPTDRGKIARIEELYGEYGIAVVWDDETVEERRARG